MTLGCADKEDCGCGCKECNDKHSTPVVTNKVQQLPTKSNTSRFHRGYQKENIEDITTKRPERSGYGKKTLVSTSTKVKPSGYSKKEIVKVEPAREITIEYCVPRIREDDTGLWMSGISLGVLLLFYTNKEG